MGLTSCGALGPTRQRWRTLPPGKERAGQHWRWPYRSRRMGRRCGGPSSQQDLLQSRACVSTSERPDTGAVVSVR